MDNEERNTGGGWDWFWVIALAVVYTTAVIALWDLFQWYIQ